MKAHLYIYFAFTLFILLAAPPGHAQDTRTIVRQIIQASINNYPGNCPCPYNTDRAGRQCGGRSAWSKPGGYAPICYGSDVTDQMVDSFKARQTMRVVTTLPPDKKVFDPKRQLIKDIQTELARLGCNPGSPDGIIGANSSAAIVKFGEVLGWETSTQSYNSGEFLQVLKRLDTKVCK